MGLAQIAIIVSAVAALGTVYNGYVSARASSEATKGEQKGTQLDLAWKMQEKQIERLEKANESLDSRLQLADTRIVQLNTELQECKRGRHQLEVQVEILRLQVGGKGEAP